MSRKYAHINGDLQEICTIDEIAKLYGVSVDQMAYLMADAGIGSIDENGVFRPTQMAIDAGMVVDSHGNKWGCN